MRCRLISEPVPVDCEDDYTVPRSLVLMSLEKAFAGEGFDSYTLRKITENLLSSSAMCLEPHEMNEAWAREQVEHVAAIYRDCRSRGEVPKIDISESFSKPLYLVPQAELERLREEHERRYRLENPPMPVKDHEPPREAGTADEWEEESEETAEELVADLEAFEGDERWLAKRLAILENAEEEKIWVKERLSVCRSNIQEYKKRLAVLMSGQEQPDER